MPYSFNGRRQPQRPPEPKAEQPEPADDPDAEPTALDEADKIAAMSDADFLAMLARQKAEFVPPPAIEPAPWQRSQRPKPRRHSRLAVSLSWTSDRMRRASGH
jgi:hypothetical protein